MEEWIKSIINSTSHSRPEKPPRINRVPSVLRDTKDYEKYCEPRFVSIGPYHYGKSNLHHVQKLKYRIANKFAANDQQQLKVLYDKLFEKIEEVKESYDNENLASEFDDNKKLAQMMLLDGCFVLFYIKSVVGEKTYKEDLEMKSHVITCVGQDLFLLENQLPFFVLWELIINSTKLITKDQWMESINLFIQKNIMAPQKKEWKEELQPLDYEMQRPAHLLELLHQRMVPPIYYKHTMPKPVQFTFPSLKELTAVGIHLKPKVDKDQVTEISYHRPTLLKIPSCCDRGRPTVIKIPCDRPTLKIPCITVDGSTRSKVLNLIAYEMCPDAESDLVFTNYICFMDSPIDNHEDVKKLRSAKILQNCLHRDHDVAKLFNEIGSNSVSIPFVPQYEKLIEELQEDCKKMAEFRAGHCKNRWTILILIGALLALLLTGIQTYFQIWSSPCSQCDALCKHIKMTHHIWELGFVCFVVLSFPLYTQKKKKPTPIYM